VQVLYSSIQKLVLHGEGITLFTAVGLMIGTCSAGVNLTNRVSVDGKLKICSLRRS